MLAALLLLVLVAVADVFRPRPRPREVEGEAAAVAADVEVFETRELVRRVLVLAPNVTASSTTVANTETLLVEAPPLAPRAPAADEPRLPRAMAMIERDNLKEINGD